MLTEDRRGEMERRGDKEPMRDLPKKKKKERKQRAEMELMKTGLKEERGGSFR